MIFNNLSRIDVLPPCQKCEMTKYILGSMRSRPPLSRNPVNYYYYYYYDGTAFKVRDASREGPLMSVLGLCIMGRGGRVLKKIGKMLPLWKKNHPRDFV